MVRKATSYLDVGAAHRAKM